MRTVLHGAQTIRFGGLVFVLGCTDPATVAQRAAPLTAALHAPDSSPEALGQDGRPTASLTTAFGHVEVRDDGTLSLDARLLDRNVLPELALSADGRTLAYPRRSALGAELLVRVLPDGDARSLSQGLQVADRPIFAHDGNTLYAWGSDANERFVGLYALTASTPPRRLCNAGITRLDDPRFLDPPTDPSSQRFEGAGTLTWTTPFGPRRLTLAQRAVAR